MAPDSSPRRLLKTRFGFGPSLLLLGTLPLLTSCGEEAPRSFSTESEEELAQIIHTLRPGDWLQYREVAVLVPPAGEGVHAEAVLSDGRMVELQVKTAVDGRVALVRHPAPVKALKSTDHTAMSACTEGAYNLLGYRWTHTYHWSFNAGTTPGELTVAEAEQAIREATNNITTGRNDCGLTDAINASHQYEGRTTTGTDINTTGGCNARDGRSVTGFGDLPNGTLAVTCTWYDGSGSAVESDARINKVEYTWTTSAESASCSNRFGLEAVMTHERGHTFGLGHVAPGSPLTMRPGIGACDGSTATLGLGDVRGLRQRY
ncbi:matrixin family metalloprotease [Archangium sp.]|uniref:matrixin family metalloprotease n=1 Tax=Archangium sp. TaxID=1872627 RepID=UPI002D679BF5|nr:matrixin family metalloprotease [Archangium sp.]HYO56496.1 matrixin family metalloprotease [Archangium sp.]